MYTQVFSAAKEVDQAFAIIFGFTVFVLLAITAVMLFFLWRYHYKRHPKPADIDGSVWAEILWTVLPTLIVLGLFWTGWTSFKAMRTIPDGAMVVEAEGRMWSWKFTYPNGKTSDILVVPVNTPVKLALSAKDVIHSFYVPAMRLKWDMVPGMDTDAWFESDSVGDFDIFCAEYCGLRHSDMVTTLRVVEPADYEAWLAEERTASAAAADGQAPAVHPGQALADEEGCLSCHSTDGSESVGPSFLGLAGSVRTVEAEAGGPRQVTADPAYLRESILQPGTLITEGYFDGMPPYDGMDEERLRTIVEWLGTLAQAEGQ